MAWNSTRVVGDQGGQISTVNRHCLECFTTCSSRWLAISVWIEKKWCSNLEDGDFQSSHFQNYLCIDHPFSTGHLWGLCIRRFASNCKKQWSGCRLSNTYILGRLQSWMNITYLFSAWLLGIKPFLDNESQILPASDNIFILDSGFY